MKRFILILCLVALGWCPTHAAVPFNPDRETLYTREDLWDGFNPVLEKDKSPDGEIFKYFDHGAKYAPPLDELRQQRRHDAGIEYAVNQLLQLDSTGAPHGRRVVVIMGSHSKNRDDVWYARVARLTYELSKQGYFVVSGGGPGLMEAAHLGAYMQYYSPAELDTALAILAKSKQPPPGKYQYQMEDWWDVAQQVTTKFQKAGDSLGIPTWFYGHEGANAFSLHVAKYLSNSLREEKMCAIGLNGVIFAPGGPGTMQEVFMDAAENAYHSYNYSSPMVFFNDGLDARVMSALVLQAAPDYRAQNMLLISAEPAEIIKFLDVHPPVFIPYRP